MHNSAVDLLALGLGVAVAAATASVLLWADRGRDMRRVWTAGAVLALVFALLGVIDLLRATPRETPAATAVVGALLPVLAAIGVTRVSRRVRPWWRWLLIFLTAFVLLFGSLLLAVTLISRLSG